MASNHPADSLPPIKCVQCGYETRLGARFCARCGASLPANEVARMPAPPQRVPVPPKPMQRRASSCAPIALAAIVGVVMLCACLVVMLSVDELRHLEDRDWCEPNPHGDRDAPLHVHANADLHGNCHRNTFSHPNPYAHPRALSHAHFFSGPG